MNDPDPRPEQPVAAQGVAVVLCRLLGLWFVCEGVFRAFDHFVWEWSMRAKGAGAGTGWTAYPPMQETLTSTSELYLHDTYYVITHASLSLVSPALKVAIGLILLFAAGRVARFLASGVER